MGEEEGMPGVVAGRGEEVLEGKKKAEVSLWAKEDELQAVECWWRWRCTVLLSGDNVVVSVEVLW